MRKLLIAAAFAVASTGAFAQGAGTQGNSNAAAGATSPGAGVNTPAVTHGNVPDASDRATVTDSSAKSNTATTGEGRAVAKDKK
jgi:uncharacterized protein YdeI (BOF family)